MVIILNLAKIWYKNKLPGLILRRCIQWNLILFAYVTIFLFCSRFTKLKIFIYEIQVLCMHKYQGRRKLYLERTKQRNDLNLPANVPVEVLTITITPGWDNGANHLINKNFAFKLLIIRLWNAQTDKTWNQSKRLSSWSWRDWRFQVFLRNSRQIKQGNTGIYERPID